MPHSERRPARRSTGKRAASSRANPALDDLRALVGLWDVTLSNARFLPDPAATVHLPASVEWIEGGEFLVIRQGSTESGAPHATWLIGRDEAGAEYVALYHDDRRVSRVYRMRFNNGQWRIWRDAPEFCQRFTGELSKNGNTIRAKWEMSRDNGATWDHDFDLTYRRVRQRVPKARRARR